MGGTMLTQRFLKRAQSYQNHAIVQNKMASELIALLRQVSHTTNFERGFEFGAAQGEFSKILLEHFTFQSLLCNDINNYAQSFVGLTKVDFACFDMNDAPKILKNFTFDLITSNACLQWLKQREVLSFLPSILESGGILALSSFGKRNLWQIKQICNVGLGYLELEDYQNILAPCKILHLSTQQYNLQFSNALEAFRHLSLSGVNAIEKGFFLSKKILQEFEARYNNTLTYESVLVLARKY